ncbi:MAG: 2,3-bisphosphoglycerate-independent phosphoglycerate mutase [Bacillota bacterium]
MGRRGLLIIADGWGYSENKQHNAIANAGTPVFDRLFDRYPWTLIEASGEHVGLESGTPGNSEVGHLTLGAGRVVDYESTRVQNAIKSGEMQKHPVLVPHLEQVKTKGGCVHLIGLLTDGNVHAHYHHFVPLAEAAKKAGISDVYLHLFTDGRDAPSGMALHFLSELETMLKASGIGTIASVVGRDYGMDRNHRWEKTKAVYDLLTAGTGRPFRSATEAVTFAYNSGLADDFVPPSILVDVAGTPIGPVRDHDLILSVNFRGDRMRQIVKAFAPGRFEKFPRPLLPNVQVLTLTDYHMNPPVPSILEHVSIPNGLAETLEHHHVWNLRISETEKFSHVTFFINGREEHGYRYQKNIHIPGPDVKDYRSVPNMSAEEIALAVVDAIRRNEFKLIIINLVNADILGHTGDMEAVIKAVEAVDQALGIIIEAAQSSNYWAVVCGDHGNAELMWDVSSNRPHVGHTTNPVPFIMVHPHGQLSLRANGSLADVAPTLLELLNIEIPKDMTGTSLVEKL